MNPKIKSSIASMVPFYFRRHYFYPVWKLFNAEIKLPELTPLEKRIFRDLENYGIAIASFSGLCPELEIEKILSYPQNRIANPPKITKKSFLRYLWDKTPDFDEENPLHSFTQSEAVKNIAAAYLKVTHNLYYLTLNLTVPSGSQERQESQLWHRDPEDRKLLKCFIYLSDVDETAGPFEYVLQSTKGRRFGNLFKQKFVEETRIGEEELYSKIPLNHIKTCTGKAGTLIFADTTGIHRGGTRPKNNV